MKPQPYHFALLAMPLLSSCSLFEPEKTWIIDKKMERSPLHEEGLPSLTRGSCLLWYATGNDPLAWGGVKTSVRSGDYSKKCLLKNWPPPPDAIEVKRGVSYLTYSKPNKDYPNYMFQKMILDVGPCILGYRGDNLVYSAKYGVTTPHKIRPPYYICE